MAEYPDFKHGTLAEIEANAFSTAGNGASLQAIVYVGTAPVHLVEGGASNVNKPILVRDIAEARKYLGYSDDWASYTLCEAMHVHFELNGVGPLVFINVLDPATHTKSTGGTASLTPENGRVVIANAEDVYLDSIVVKSGTGESQVTKEKGTDYTASYDFEKKVVNIVEVTPGSLGTGALTITWTKIDPSAVTQAAVIGTDDTYGNRTGIYVVKNVYNKTGYIPAYLLAPGFSSIPAVHSVMYANSRSISKHWNAWMFVDMPLTDNGTAITLATAPTWKNANGYNKDNESVFFPMAKGTDGNKYHLSVLNAANFQALLIENGGVPYMSGSNTACAIIEDLYFGESVTNNVIDDEIINRCLNSNGINSAAFISGRWVIWGMFAGSYSVPDATNVNVNDTCLMMLFYVTNDFQYRRMGSIDKPMPVNTLRTIVAEEQARVDALVGIGALTYGLVQLDASSEARSDIYSGDFRIIFNVTNTPLAKSITAVAKLVEDGYSVYFEALNAI